MNAIRLTNMSPLYKKVVSIENMKDWEFYEDHKIWTNEVKRLVKEYLNNELQIL
jgi:hypothetical protein